MATTADPSRTDGTRETERSTTIHRDGERRVAYSEYGRPEGSPVVFLHGTPGSRRLGKLLDEAATDHDVRLLAPDRPGYGRSSPWPDRGVSDAGGFVATVLDDAGVERAGVVAFSGGAPYALAAAATHSDRIARVDLVAGATPPAVSERTPAVQRLLGGLASTTPRVLRGLFRGQAWVAKRRDPAFVVGLYADAPESVPDDVAAVVQADFVEAFAEHRSGAVTEFRHAATDWGVDYAAVDAPVHLRHGSDDANVPVDDARRFADRLPAAAVTVLDGADHLGTLLRSAPDVMSAHA
ncbi:alpha/beta fold hydrolase [Halostella salina]|uniref:alpha/beta fold hydrolase n=1 Tax=Halostella salina TaxID=1547897 RepID=UPI000EF7CFFB|nr:alpha/beta hydrolase [Halostella salina]